ncbi:MAG: GAF domain-containing protein [Cyanobacteria bacterium J06634_6]
MVKHTVPPVDHPNQPPTDRKTPPKLDRRADRRAASDLSKQDLSQVLPAIWEAETLERSIQEALEAIRAEFGYSMLWIGMYDRFNHKLDTRGVITNGPRRFSQTSLTIHPGDLLEQVIVQQQPTVVADIREESRAGAWARVAKSFELQGTVILPIIRQSTCFGLMILGSRRWGVTPGILENSTLLAINNALAEAIHQKALEEQRSKTKQPAKPLLSLLSSLGELHSLDARLEAVAEETKRFVATPTSIFWLEPRGRHFWCRVGKLAGKNENTLPVSEIQSLYQTLCNGEMLALGELEGSLKASMANQLMLHLKAQSLMVAPICYRNELQGFITVEGNSPRIWSEAEKSYVKGVAELLGIAMPTAEMDAAVSQMRSDHLLSAGITRSIHSDRDWLHVLGLCVEQLAARMGTDQLIVLSANADRGGFDLCYRTGQGIAQSHGQRDHWQPLDTVDEQMLRRAHSPASVENLENDLKFSAWRSRLQTLGAKSLLVSNTSPGHAPEGVVIVLDKIERRWNQADREILQTLSSQIGLILHQWGLQRQSDQQAQLHETFQWGMRSLQRLSQLEALDQSAIRHISRLLHTPIVGLVTWENGASVATASSVLAQNKSFSIDAEHSIPVKTDALINWAVETEGLLTLKLEDLPTDATPWITGPEGSQLLAMALRTATDHVPNAIVVLADSATRQWSDEQTTLLAVIVSQLAWCRRHIKLTQKMLKHQQQLTRLNWYKQHQIEDLNRDLQACMKQLNLRSEAANPHQQMLVQQMDSLSDRLHRVTQNERWSIDIAQQKTPLIGLIKRATARANPLIQAKQLWSKVHCESNLTIPGDIVKIEFVLYELIAEACDRSPNGDRIDIWCRPIDEHWLEISITDEGSVSAQVMTELEKGRPTDLLSPSTLHIPENSHLWVCQSLMKTLGGEFTLSHMDDGRTLSRVILPLEAPKA